MGVQSRNKSHILGQASRGATKNLDALVLQYVDITLLMADVEGVAYLPMLH